MSVAFVFPGQGAQYVGMGLSLYESFANVKHLFDTAAKVLGHDFLQICFRGPDEFLTQTKICQPALFLHGCVAVSILRDRDPNIHCDVAFGLSLGELTALWAAGVFDFETGLHIVSMRGKLMQEACEKTQGTMLCVIGGTDDDLKSLCAETSVEIANLNCPGQIVLSGGLENIQLARELAARMSFKRAMLLNVAGAYHSRLMESARDGFEKFIKNIEFSAPNMKVLSNVTGDLVSDPEDIKQKLVEQIVSPVLFEKCCHKAIEIGVNKFLECGPGKSLAGLIRRIDKTLVTDNFDKSVDFNC